MSHGWTDTELNMGLAESALLDSELHKIIKCPLFCIGLKGKGKLATSECAKWIADPAQRSKISENRAAMRCLALSAP